VPELPRRSSQNRLVFPGDFEKATVQQTVASANVKCQTAKCLFQLDLAGVVRRPSRLKAAVRSTPISVSAVGVFLRKSARFNNFLDRATWLRLALERPLLELAGTISGTVSTV
jgi:hypothetical protein